MMCNTCIHKIVCSKYIACGEVKTCEHYREERKGRWVVKNIKNSDYRYCFCSECETVGSIRWKVCPVCTAEMRGAEDG
jgi:hypothetical protein